MTDNPLNNIDKYEKDSRIQNIWDVTSLDRLKQCPRKYHLIKEGWRPKIERAGASTWGIAYHKAREAYDRQLFETPRKRSLAVEAAVHEALKSGGEALASSEDSARTVQTLIRAIVWYDEQYSGDDFTTMTLPDGSPAIEVRFEVPVPGTDVRLSGRIDKIVVDHAGCPLFIEYKSTKTTLGTYYFDSFNLAPQISCYLWVAQRILPQNRQPEGVLIDACQTAKDFTRFERSRQLRTIGQITEFEENMRFYIKLAQELEEAAYFPANENGCGSYGGCQFRRVCSQSPHIRQVYLEEDFVLSPYMGSKKDSMT